MSELQRPIATIARRTPNERGPNRVFGLQQQPAIFHRPKEPMDAKSSAIMSGIVERIIVSPLSNEPDKAQIQIHVVGPDLFRKIRIDNTLTNENGEEVSLKLGAQVEVTVEAEAVATTHDK